MIRGSYMTAKDYLKRAFPSQPTPSERPGESGPVRTFDALLSGLGNTAAKPVNPAARGLTVADYMANPVRALRVSTTVMTAASLSIGNDAKTADPVEGALDQPLEAAVANSVAPTAMAAVAEDPPELRETNAILSQALGPMPVAPGPPADPLPEPVSVASTDAAGLSERQKIDHTVLAVAQRYDLPVALIRGVIRAESDFQTDAVSPAGACGLMQLMPGTARELGVNDPFDPVENIDGGARYLRKMLDLFDGDLKQALMAYNAGPGTVRRYDGDVPYRETRRYVDKVLKFSGLDEKLT